MSRPRFPHTRRPVNVLLTPLCPHLCICTSTPRSRRASLVLTLWTTVSFATFRGMLDFRRAAEPDRKPPKTRRLPRTRNFLRLWREPRTAISRGICEFPLRSPQARRWHIRGGGTFGGVLAIQGSSASGSNQLPKIPDACAQKIYPDCDCNSCALLHLFRRLVVGRIVRQRIP